MVASFPPFFGDDDIRWKYDLAGGALMDLGCYPVSYVRWLAGGNPTEILEAVPDMKHAQVDKGMRAEMKFPHDVTGKIEANFTTSYWNPGQIIPWLQVEGDQGTLTMTNWLIPTLYHKITVTKKDGTKRTEQKYGEGWSTYRYQLEEFVKLVRAKQLT